MTVPDTSRLVAWLQEQGLELLVLVVIAFVAFQASRPLVHRLIARLIERGGRGSEAAELTADETRKRAATIEDLLATILRLAVVLVAILVLLTIFDLLPVVAGLGIVLAALALAGQGIVLDYLMGILIVLEGPFSKGDVVQIGGVEGEVEEVGLRRTILRDASGTVHSVSNGEIRVASNLTRIYARMVVDVTVAFATDLERATAIVNEVGAVMAADPEWEGRVLEAPRLLRVDALGDLGATLRITGKVRAADRWAAPGELRRRLLAAFQANGIEISARHRVVLARESGGAPASGTGTEGGPDGPDGPADGDG